MGMLRKKWEQEPDNEKDEEEREAATGKQASKSMKMIMFTLKGSTRMNRQKKMKINVKAAVTCSSSTSGLRIQPRSL